MIRAYLRIFASNFFLLCGEMTELAEGARLEIVCSAKSGTVGSNPTLSAKKFLGDADERRFTG